MIVRGHCYENIDLKTDIYNNVTKLKKNPEQFLSKRLLHHDESKCTISFTKVLL